MASFCSFVDELGTETVEFYVGPDRRKFVVHKNLLVTKSNYFRGALTGTLYKEAAEGVVNLEEDDPAAFALLVGWVYRGNIPKVRPYIMKPDFSRYKTSSSFRENERRVPLSTKEQPNLNTELPDPEIETGKVRIEHISAHSPFSSFSPEEVRLADYENARENYLDPLRRDAGVSNPKTDRAGADHKKKKLASRGRREWLSRKFPASSVTPILVSATTRAPDSPLSKLVPKDGGDKSPDGGKSSDQAVRENEKAAPKGDTSSAPKSALQKAAPRVLSILSSQPTFTFRAERPSFYTQAPTGSTIAPSQKPATNLSYAAIAAISGHRQNKSTRDRNSSSPASGVSTETRYQKRAKGAESPQTNDSAATPTTILQAPPVENTVEAWAARVSRYVTGPARDEDVQSGSSESSGNDVADEQQRTDWPSKTSAEVSKEATVLRATHWLDWKADRNSPVFHGREEAFRENNKHQLALVHLVVMAEKFCWDELFNAAIDAYLDGEAVMNRDLVPLDHLEIAYAECYETSPLRRFFSDMVHFEVKTLMTHSRYLELALTYEDFLADLFKRLDYQTWLPGKHPFTTLRNPLTIRKCHYHHHQDWSGCCTF